MNKILILLMLGMIGSSLAKTVTVHLSDVADVDAWDDNSKAILGGVIIGIILGMLFIPRILSILLLATICAFIGWMLQGNAIITANEELQTINVLMDFSKI